MSIKFEMKTTKLLINLIFLLLFVCGCGPHYQTLEVTDLKSKRTYILRSNSGHPVKMDLFVSGNVTDTVKLNHWTLLPGTVDTLLHSHDFYNKKFLISVEPIKNTEGKLLFLYKF